KYLLPKVDAVLSMPAVNITQDSQEIGINVLLRMELLKHSCLLRSPMCENHVLTLIQNWMENEDRNLIPLDLQPMVYCAGVAAGDKVVWDFIKRIHDRTPPSEQKMFLFRALGCTRDIKILTTFLEESWQPSSTYSALDALEVTADNPLGNKIVLQSLKDNFDKIRPLDFVRILSFMSDYWSDPELVTDLNSFVKSHEDLFKPF
ncbi:unnamed protein product, partial [Allacma fusca]